MVRNSFLRRLVGGAVKHDFRMYIQQYTSPNEHFEYGCPRSNAVLCLFTIKIFVSSQIGALQATCHPTKYDLINDVETISESISQIYCRQFLMLSNQ